MEPKIFGQGKGQVLNGYLITLEGIDGCGKTTQARMLQARFEKETIPHRLLREPGGTPIGEQIRQLLLHKDYPLTIDTEIMLYLAARAELVTTVIRPALESGRVVICDRYFDSTVAYQGYGGGGDRVWIGALNEKITAGLRPDLTFLFDLSVEEALDRRGRGGDRIEERSLSFHRRVRRGFLALAAAEPDRVSVIDAAAPAEQQHEALWAGVNALLRRGRPDEL